MWALEWKILKERSEASPFSRTPCLGNTWEYSHKPASYFYKLESLTYILTLTVWVYLYSICFLVGSVK